MTLLALVACSWVCLAQSILYLCWADAMSFAYTIYHVPFTGLANAPVLIGASHFLGYILVLINTYNCSSTEILISSLIFLNTVS